MLGPAPFGNGESATYPTASPLDAAWSPPMISFEKTSPAFCAGETSSYARLSGKPAVGGALQRADVVGRRDAEVVLGARRLTGEVDARRDEAGSVTDVDRSRRRGL